MANLWPWLAIAGLGALHGLSPANGWMFAAACGVRARDGAQARRALLPIAIGHAASIAIVALVLLPLAAVGVHTAAMLVTTGAVASGACRGIAMHPRLLNGTAPRHAWTAALAVTGALLMALR